MTTTRTRQKRNPRCHCARLLTTELEKNRKECNDCYDLRQQLNTRASGEELEQWRDLVVEGKRAAQELNDCQWHLGDLAQRVTANRHYGQHSLELYATDIGVEYPTLSEYARVAKAFENPIRIGISWSHHQAVAAREDRLAWLQTAKEQGWTVRQMWAAVREADTEATPDPPPAPEADPRVPPEVTGTPEGAGDPSDPPELELPEDSFTTDLHDLGDTIYRFMEHYPPDRIPASDVYDPQAHARLRDCLDYLNQVEAQRFLHSVVPTA